MKGQVLLHSQPPAFLDPCADISFLKTWPASLLSLESLSVVGQYWSSCWASVHWKVPDERKDLAVTAKVLTERPVRLDLFEHASTNRPCTEALPRKGLCYSWFS